MHYVFELIFFAVIGTGLSIRFKPNQQTNSNEDIDRFHTETQLVSGEILSQVKFHCKDRPSGYYADPKFRCEVFHYCHEDETRVTIPCYGDNLKHKICLFRDVSRQLCGNKEIYLNLPGETQFKETTSTTASALNGATDFKLPRVLAQPMRTVDSETRTTPFSLGLKESARSSEQLEDVGLYEVIESFLKEIDSEKGLQASSRPEPSSFVRGSKSNFGTIRSHSEARDVDISQRHDNDRPLLVEIYDDQSPTVEDLNDFSLYKRKAKKLFLAPSKKTPAKHPRRKKRMVVEEMSVRHPYAVFYIKMPDAANGSASKFMTESSLSSTQSTRKVSSAPESINEAMSSILNQKGMAFAPAMVPSDVPTVPVAIETRRKKKGGKSKKKPHSQEKDALDVLLQESSFPYQLLSGKPENEPTPKESQTIGILLENSALLKELEEQKNEPSLSEEDALQLLLQEHSSPFQETSEQQNVFFYVPDEHGTGQRGNGNRPIVDSNQPGSASQQNSPTRNQGPPRPSQQSSPGRPPLQSSGGTSPTVPQQENPVILPNFPFQVPSFLDTSNRGSFFFGPQLFSNEPSQQPGRRPQQLLSQGETRPPQPQSNQNSQRPREPQAQVTPNNVESGVRSPVGQGGSNTGPRIRTERPQTVTETQFSPFQSPFFQGFPSFNELDFNGPPFLQPGPNVFDISPLSNQQQPPPPPRNQPQQRPQLVIVDPASQVAAEQPRHSGEPQIQLISNERRPQQFNNDFRPQLFNTEPSPQQFAGEGRPQQNGGNARPQPIGEPQQVGGDRIPQQFLGSQRPQQSSGARPQHSRNQQRPQTGGQSPLFISSEPRPQSGGQDVPIFVFSEPRPQSGGSSRPQSGRPSRPASGRPSRPQTEGPSRPQVTSSGPRPESRPQFVLTESRPQSGGQFRTQLTSSEPRPQSGRQSRPQITSNEQKPQSGRQSRPPQLDGDSRPQITSNEPRPPSGRQSRPPQLDGDSRPQLTSNEPRPPSGRQARPPQFDGDSRPPRPHHQSGERPQQFHRDVNLQAPAPEIAYLQQTNPNLSQHRPGITQQNRNRPSNANQSPPIILTVEPESVSPQHRPILNNELPSSPRLQDRNRQRGRPQDFSVPDQIQRPPYVIQDINTNSQQQQRHRNPTPNAIPLSDVQFPRDQIFQLPPSLIQGGGQNINGIPHENFQHLPRPETLGPVDYILQYVPQSGGSQSGALPHDPRQPGAQIYNPGIHYNNPYQPEALFPPLQAPPPMPPLPPPRSRRPTSNPQHTRPPTEEINLNTVEETLTTFGHRTTPSPSESPPRSRERPQEVRGSLPGRNVKPEIRNKPTDNRHPSSGTRDRPSSNRNVVQSSNQPDSVAGTRGRPSTHRDRPKVQDRPSVSQSQGERPSSINEPSYTRDASPAVVERPSSARPFDPRPSVEIRDRPSSVRGRPLEDSENPSSIHDKTTNFREPSQEHQDRPSSIRNRPTIDPTLDIRGRPNNVRDRPSSVRDRPTSDRDRPTTGRDPSSDRPSSVRDRPTTGRDPSSEIRDRPSSVRDRPLTGRDPSSENSDRPTSVRDRPFTGRDPSSENISSRPSSTRDRPNTRDKPIDDRPTSIRDSSEENRERPSRVRDRPLQIGESPTSFRQNSFDDDRTSGLRERPSSFSEIPGGISYYTRGPPSTHYPTPEEIPVFHSNYPSPSPELPAVRERPKEQLESPPSEPSYPFRQEYPKVNDYYAPSYPPRETPESQDTKPEFIPKTNAPEVVTHSYYRGNSEGNRGSYPEIQNGFQPVTKRPQYYAPRTTEAPRREPENDYRNRERVQANRYQGYEAEEPPQTTTPQPSPKPKPLPPRPTFPTFPTFPPPPRRITTTPRPKEEPETEISYAPTEDPNKEIQLARSRSRYTTKKPRFTSTSTEYSVNEKELATDDPELTTKRRSRKRRPRPRRPKITTIFPPEEDEEQVQSVTEPTTLKEANPQRQTTSRYNRWQKQTVSPVKRITSTTTTTTVPPSQKSTSSDTEKTEEYGSRLNLFGRPRTRKPTVLQSRSTSTPSSSSGLAREESNKVTKTPSYTTRTRKPLKKRLRAKSTTTTESPDHTDPIERSDEDLKSLHYRYEDIMLDDIGHSEYDSGIGLSGDDATTELPQTESVEVTEATFEVNTDVPNEKDSGATSDGKNDENASRLVASKFQNRPRTLKFGKPRLRTTLSPIVQN